MTQNEPQDDLARFFRDRNYTGSGPLDHLNRGGFDCQTTVCYENIEACLMPDIPRLCGRLIQIRADLQQNPS